MSVEMDTMCELASELVERDWNKKYWSTGKPHTYKAENGDWRYVEEAQDEFNEVLDVLDNMLNKETTDGNK